MYVVKLSYRRRRHDRNERRISLLWHRCHRVGIVVSAVYGPPQLLSEPSKRNVDAVAVASAWRARGACSRSSTRHLRRITATRTLVRARTPTARSKTHRKNIWAWRHPTRRTLWSPYACAASSSWRGRGLLYDGQKDVPAGIPCGKTWPEDHKWVPRARQGNDRNLIRYDCRRRVPLRHPAQQGRKSDLRRSLGVVLQDVHLHGHGHGNIRLTAGRHGRCIEAASWLTLFFHSSARRRDTMPTPVTDRICLRDEAQLCRLPARP